MFPIFIVSEKITKLFSIFIDVYAIAIFPFVISKESLSHDVINHEKIHFKQQLELLIIPFYIIYSYFFFLNYIKYKDYTKAYLSIPFEKEAYENEDNLNYLDERQMFSWIKYI